MDRPLFFCLEDFMGGVFERKSNNYIGRETEEEYIKRLLEEPDKGGANRVGVSKALGWERPSATKEYKPSFLSKVGSVYMKGVNTFVDFLYDILDKRKKKAPRTKPNPDWRKVGTFISDQGK